MSENTKDAVIENMRFRLLIDSVIDYAIYMIDPDGIITSWNSGAKRFKGYEEAEILGEHFSRFYTAEDRAAGLPQRALNTAINEGRFEGEGWRVRKDGTNFWSHVVIDPIIDPDGRLLGFAKITRDLTDRKMAEETLKQSEQQFRLLVQGVTDYAIYMLSPEGRVSNWNQGAQRIKGYLPEEIIGQHFSIFYTPEDRELGEPQRSLEIATREGRFENKSWRMRKDGTRFLAHVVVDAIRGDTGILLGFAKITRDITEAHQSRQALEKTREALFQAQKMQAIGQLSGGIAHDFNNLLTVILGNLEIVQKRMGADPKISRLLENATQGALRGVSLTQRMLAFARRQELKTESVDIAQLVQGITGLLRSSLGPGIRIETRFPDDLQPVLADNNQLELALLNLATNARDAMPDGGTVTITAQPQVVLELGDSQLPAGRYVCLSLTDTGEGMDAQTLASARDPFFTTKGLGKGTGLGLSMVHGFIEQLGGRFILKSEKGQGTTAELWIPVALEVVASKPQFSSGAPVSVPRLSVLVVDDDSLVLTSTSLLLEDLGHRVLGATSGEQALRLFDQGEVIDLMITDMAMPKMSGAQLAHAVRMLKPDLPIILATGYAEPLEGFAAELPRLPKPFTQMGLVAIIAQSMK
ncbi:PAS domain S-box protein [Pseudomonas granadensis]|uniref:histidine kinase n=1 Tax=Pseudomonas granadensis TaxID=1421430 RepID=A0ABX7GA52_9PSED|nr:PAS domain-containing sensor histidine kinase [Pseudomonas granadensis]MBN6775998.1 PAS domain S-box protein [Pseudomonas granadensis]MBN6807642.1 PAS domain S-box protein [Pseudomonas granadensis]MBN6833870.1 PAS domain S-box protein [Pseudomonas granadensis]MBN6841383.1 PAS domain S-box protein [Pseudomonas granadensis]MBN6870058.1 PAS domain S-box protein [Pseudomonas granadensis]